MQKDKFFCFNFENNCTQLCVMLKSLVTLETSEDIATYYQTFFWQTTLYKTFFCKEYY